MFTNLSIKKFISFSFGTVVVLIVMLSIFIYTSLISIEKDVDLIVDENIGLLTKVSELRHHTLSYRRFALDYGLTESKSEHKLITPKIAFHDENVSKVLKELDKVVTESADIEFVSTFRKNIDDYRKSQVHYINLIDNDQIDLARETILGPMLNPFNAMIAPVEKFQAALQATAVKLRTKGKEHINNILLTMIVSCTFLIILTVGVGWLLARKINAPLATLNAQMQRMGSGDLSQQIDMSMFAKDELGSSAEYFSSMQNSVTKLISEISENVTTLDDSSRRLSDQSATAEERMRVQQSDINKVTETMDNLALSFQEVAGKTSATAEVATDASREAQNGDKIVRLAISQIEEVNQVMQEANSVISALREDSSNISTVTEVIRSIADQTNLLALNAAIEAARAGEQGRGFAVVADEVRTLAQRTQNSINEINTTITSLQARSQQAADSMDRSQAGMIKSVDQAKLAGESITEIARSVASISDTTNQIASATEQQTSVTQDQTAKIKLIDSAASDVSVGAKQALKLCQDLNGINEKLNHLTQRFSL